MNDVDVGDIRIAATSYKGIPRLDIRKYFQADDGEMRPTRKGISLLVEDGTADAVIKAAAEMLGLEVKCS